MLICNAELPGGAVSDVRISKGIIGAIGDIVAEAGEPLLDARGGALLPGLHDHHIHLFALAARANSVFCGPPEVVDRDALAGRLAVPGRGWLRAVGYHESVAGMLDAAALDRMVPNRPVRLQHRGGRMWFLNSAALDDLLSRSPAPPGLERDSNGYTGRLFDEDGWLRSTLAGQMPALDEVSRTLARFGVTGITDMSPDNDPATARHFAMERERGALVQNCWLAGRLSLAEAAFSRGLALASIKLHLHEAALPPFDDAVAFIRAGHVQDRPVAIHCTTEVELVFALAAIREAGAVAGDRIEHASVAPDSLIAQIAELGLAVVTQPNFVVERGDAYRAAIAETVWPELYRLRSFADASIVLAGGSDAPFGMPDPWSAMAAAVDRRTQSGPTLGEQEALSPEEALNLFLARPDRLDCPRRVAVGEPADLCLLDRPWAIVRSALSSGFVRASIIRGRIVFDRIDQTPLQRDARGNALA